MGVVLHGTNYWRPLIEKQAQSDVLRYFKQLMSESRISCTMVHVHGHMDKHLRQDQLTPLQRVNIRANGLASSALMAALATQIFVKDIFPSEGVLVSIGTMRITGSSKAEITHLWGEQVAQELFHRREIVHTNNFLLVYWEGMDKVMRGFPEPFRVWITKHVSHFNGTNRMLSQFPATETRAKVANKCLNCGFTDESTAHITRCCDKGQTLSFSESITSLMQWLGDQQMDLEVVHLFRHYLSGRGTPTMASLLVQPSSYRLTVEYYDRLGWNNFLKGQISALWGELRAWDIHDRRLERNADYWARGLMHQLLEMVHQQWLYRNATVHMSLQDGLPRDKLNRY
jgi:hypothetical protein